MLKIPGLVVILSSLLLLFSVTACMAADTETAAGAPGRAGEIKQKLGADTGDPVDETIYSMVFKDRRKLYELVEEALRRYMDDPKDARFELLPEDPARLLAGRFKRIDFQVNNAMMRGLLVTKARIRLTDCCLDLRKLIKRKKFRFRHTDNAKADLMLVVTEKALNDLIKSKRSSVRNPGVTLKPGYLIIRGRIRIFLFRNRFRIAGRLVVKDGNKVYFHPSGVKIDFLPLPGFIIRSISRRINPLATFDSFKFSINLSRIRITDKAIYISTEGMKDDVDRLVAAESTVLPPPGSPGKEESVVDK